MVRRQSPALFRSKFLSAEHLNDAASYIKTLPDVAEVYVFSSSSDSEIVFVAEVSQQVFEDFLKFLAVMEKKPDLLTLRAEQLRLATFDAVFEKFPEWRARHWPFLSTQNIDLLLLPRDWQSDASELNNSYYSERVRYIQSLANAQPLFHFY